MPFFSESELLHHDGEYEGFYSTFVALSTHHITTFAAQGKFLTQNVLFYLGISENFELFSLIGHFSKTLKLFNKF